MLLKFESILDIEDYIQAAHLECRDLELCHSKLRQIRMFYLLSKSYPYGDLFMLSQSDFIKQSRRDRNAQIQTTEKHERLKSKKGMVSKEKHRRYK